MKMQLLFFCGLLLLAAAPGVASESRESCLDKALADVGIENFHLMSDPKLIAEILEQDMFLADLSSIRKVLGNKLKEPMSMLPLLVRIRSGILAKHPAVVDFLCEAHKQSLLSKVDVRRMIHHTFILEDIISGMVADWRLMEDVHTAFLQKRAAYGVREGTIGSMMDIYVAGAGLFGAAKAVTMDATMAMYKQIRERGAITTEEIEARKKGLRLNIMEAYGTDRVHRFKKNSYAGLALAAVSPETLRITGTNKQVEYIFDQEWTSLYQTWNLAFITGNLNNLHLLYPKLLIPSVVCAEPNNYLFNRALALWTSLNFVLLAKLEQRGEIELVNARELAKLWGRINYKYAERYIAKHEDGRAGYFLSMKMKLDDNLEADWDWLTQLIPSFGS